MKRPVELPLTGGCNCGAVRYEVSEPLVGAMVIAPAALDALRYYFPDRTWLRWASRAVKVGSVLFVIRAAQ